jgi:hypothetical protein
MLYEVVDFLLLIRSEIYPDLFRHIVAIRNNWPQGKGHNPHTFIAHNTTWVAYKALRTPRAWQPYAETCLGRFWSVLIIKNTEHLLVHLHTDFSVVHQTRRVLLFKHNDNLTLLSCE